MFIYIHSSPQIINNLVLEFNSNLSHPKNIHTSALVEAYAIAVLFFAKKYETSHSNHSSRIQSFMDTNGSPEIYFNEMII